MTRIVWIAALLLASGCGIPEFPNASGLEDLKLLAMVADLPEANPGETVTLTPYLSDLNGAGRALTYNAEWCINSGVELGKDPSCEGNASRQVIADGQPVTGLAAPNYVGAVNTLSLMVPAADLVFAGRSAIDQANGVVLLVLYEIFSGSESLLKSHKRILVSTRTMKNQNPVVPSVQSAGADVTALPGAAASLMPTFAASSTEDYSVLNADGSTEAAKEDITVSWFASDGSLKFTKTDEIEAQEFTPPSAAPAGRNVIFVVVARDSRGGSGILILNW